MTTQMFTEQDENSHLRLTPPPPSSSDISKHMVFGEWLRNVGEREYEDLGNATDPKEYPQGVLEKAKQRATSKQWRDNEEIRSLLESARDHAAWFIMKHFPHASYTRPGGENSPIPSNHAILLILNNWRWAYRKPPFEFNPQYPPRTNPSRHPSYDDQQYPVTTEENCKNWEKRKAKTLEYLAEYQKTKTVPPSPFVHDPEQEDQLINRESWQEFFDHRDDPKGIPQPDTSILRYRGVGFRNSTQAHSQGKDTRPN